MGSLINNAYMYQISYPKATIYHLNFLDFIKKLLVSELKRKKSFLSKSKENIEKFNFVLEDIPLIRRNILLNDNILKEDNVLLPELNIEEESLTNLSPLSEDKFDLQLDLCQIINSFLSKLRIFKEDNLLFLGIREDDFYNGTLFPIYRLCREVDFAYAGSSTSLFFYSIFQKIIRNLDELFDIFLNGGEVLEHQNV